MKLVTAISIPILVVLLFVAGLSPVRSAPADFTIDTTYVSGLTTS